MDQGISDLCDSMNIQTLYSCDQKKLSPFFNDFKAVLEPKVNI